MPTQQYLSLGSPYLLGPNPSLVHQLITELHLTCDQFLAMTLKQRVDRIQATPYAQMWAHGQFNGIPVAPINWSFWADQILHNCQATAQTKSTAPGADPFLRASISGPETSHYSTGSTSHTAPKPSGWMYNRTGF